MTVLGDWRDIRSAIEAAYAKIGEVHTGNIPRRDWDLVESAIAEFKKNSELMCGECRESINFREEIVCLDCGTPLHRSCADRHFWPNGRPNTGIHP